MAFTDPVELLKFLQLDPAHYAPDIPARRLFPMRVPRPFAALMQKGEPNDPLLKQVLPDREEFVATEGFGPDPLGEQGNPTAGMLHKYQSRVLLLVRGGCAVNCRYCFRRHFPYADNAVSKREWLPVIESLKSSPEINEVIFSGGDPLMANDQHLSWLADQITQLPQIKRLRIHTRLPVVIPSRIDDTFIQWFANMPVKPILVLHINHSREISPALADRVTRLKTAGVTVLNQAVLLRGINDSVDAQVALSEALFEAGVLPYYLHLLDKVDGAAHFDTPVDSVRQIMRGMLKALPGFLVPKVVREVAGESSKSVVDYEMLDDGV